mmetsp:Transcript_11534/g.26684  ORF Transcript_11534/g.26684 Transcript_11534/m.26684 type:complete len:118 (+) Transcript_11534:119-472(+)|eukprot:CAMPEP_0119475334 /NCGR_PEP_ID=MMETSP1344-20130328/6260_1 /TAXON_ID=236787 /ORGANISM="Florenciella parvula, Strain CCMP2471" /LENGTH=117 /DNA_ID=CAMNT_0007508827 /DNA_START=118 /DNA_END=471 /DNA_ORIENTATION=-
MASLLKGSAKGKGTKIKVEVEDFITTAETFALTSPDRAGFLVKQGQKNTSSKKSRYFVLDGNLLVYYERENDPSSAVGVIYLERSSARSLPNKSGAEDGGFPLVLTTVRCGSRGRDQ